MIHTVLRFDTSKIPKHSGNGHWGECVLLTPFGEQLVQHRMSTSSDCQSELVANLFDPPDLLVQLSDLHDLLFREWHLTAPPLRNPCPPSSIIPW